MILDAATHRNLSREKSVGCFLGNHRGLEEHGATVLPGEP